MKPIGIVADDMTGAADTGVQFSRLGAEVLVLVSLERLPRELDGKWDIVVVNTENRNRAPDDARARIEVAQQFLATSGWPLQYLKVDSTLRGNWRVELESVTARCGGWALVAPAFPLAGRTVEGGILMVNGVPVDRSEMGQDGLAPASSGNLVTLLAGGEGDCHLLELEVVRRGPDAAAGWFDAVVGKGARPLVVCDAQEQSDLGTVAEAILPRITDGVVAGSAGMARELAPRLLAGDSRVGRAPALAPREGIVLVVAGSRSVVTQTQVDFLRDEPGVLHLSVDPAWPTGREWDAHREALAAEITEASDQTRRVVLVTVKPGDAPEDGDAFRAQSDRINHHLGELISTVARRSRLAGLVMTGGDIAQAGMSALEAQGIRLGEEVAPGVPLGWLVGGPEEGLPLVTKAGGFGEADTLSKAVLSIAG